MIWQEMVLFKICRLYLKTGHSDHTTHSDSPHIDIYDNSEVQPPSYLNVKDAPNEAQNCKYGNDSSIHYKNSVHGNGSSVKPNLSDFNACKESNMSDQETCRKNSDNRNKSQCKNGPKRHNERCGYNLTRSKSVCDFSAINHARLLDTSESAFGVPHKRILEQSSLVNSSLASLSTTNSGVSSSQATYGVLSNKSSNIVKTDKCSPNQQKVSKIVRNRTILGSFPLFYKLSQSLSSLNSGGLSVDTFSTSKSGLQNREKYTKLIEGDSSSSEKGGISSLSYPKKSNPASAVQPGATLGGIRTVNSSTIMEYDMGCFYVEDSNIKER